MSTTTLLEVVKNYATENYTNGWDVVLETLEDQQIEKIIGTATTEMGAKRNVSRWLKGKVDTPPTRYELDNPEPPADLVRLLSI
jgi:hypothetical protein